MSFHSNEASKSSPKLLRAEPVLRPFRFTVAEFLPSKFASLQIEKAQPSWIKRVSGVLKMRGQLELVSDISRPQAEHRGVHSEHQRFKSSLFRSFYQVYGHFSGRITNLSFQIFGSLF